MAWACDGVFVRTALATNEAVESALLRNKSNTAHADKHLASSCLGKEKDFAFVQKVVGHCSFKIMFEITWHEQVMT